MWYVYVHGVFGDADDAPPGGATQQHDSRMCQCLQVQVVMVAFLAARMIRPG